MPFPRTGQGGEPHLTLPDAITGNPGDHQCGPPGAAAGSGLLSLSGAAARATARRSAARAARHRSAGSTRVRSHAGGAARGASARGGAAGLAGKGGGQ